MKIPFNKPPYTGIEDQYIQEALCSNQISGDGPFTKRCQNWFKDSLDCKLALLTSSCTHALEMSAMLIDIKPGDEVILPSFTFVSTANAFALRGAVIVFVDIRPDTMNIDESLIEEAITTKTKAIVPVHYAGVSCDMDKIMFIAKNHNLYVIEDAAQAMTSTYKGKKLGTIGHIGTYSFHETKNFTSAGEGGLLIINDEKFSERAEIIREKGTNRSQFFRGMVDKYSWVDIGSSYLMNDLSAAYLWGQLKSANKITKNRLQTWNYYHKKLNKLQKSNKIFFPAVPEDCIHNGHMFYIKVKDLETRTSLLHHLKENSILAVFHYIPLHSSKAGMAFGRMSSKDIFTTQESEKIIRLPLYYGLTHSEQDIIITSIKNFYELSE